jgi:hypothetical protein
MLKLKRMVGTHCLRSVATATTPWPDHQWRSQTQATVHYSQWDLDLSHRCDVGNSPRSTLGYGDRWRRVMTTVFLCKPNEGEAWGLERDSNRCGGTHRWLTSGQVEMGWPAMAQQQTKARPRVWSSISNWPKGPHSWLVIITFKDSDPS